MSDDLISWKYNDTQEPIKKGDLVDYEGLIGRVTNIFMPGTQLAQDCNCGNAGGLAILYDNGIACIHIFGCYGRITKKSPDYFAD